MSQLQPPATQSTGASNATSMGGNLGGNSGSAVSATGSAGKQFIPGANSGIEQTGNTAQQSFPMVAVESLLRVFSLGSLYDDIIRVSKAYYEEFRLDSVHWQQYYKPFLQNVFIPESIMPLYQGDGRGVAFPNSDPDKDLFRRGQLAAQNIKTIDIAWRTKRRVTSRYAHGEMRMDDVDATMKRYHMQVDNQVTAERMEDIYEEEFNNRRWNRLLQATNIGISASNIASAGYSSAVGAHTGNLQSMANYKTSLGNQIAATAGNYMQSRTQGGEE